MTNPGEKAQEEHPSILVIRRDNIGDLVCTTPLIRALRQRFPGARIAALVNSYNEAVLEGNPDVDAIYAYTKAKHRSPGQSLLGVYWDRFRLFRSLRRERFDYAIIASTRFVLKPLTLARQVNAKHIVGFVEGQHPATRFIDIAIPYVKPPSAHLVEELAALAKPFGISGPLPAMRITPDAGAAANARHVLSSKYPGAGPVIGIHISARKVPQRWPAGHFVGLMRALHQQYGAKFMLFWSPGEEANPLHPGDDVKAKEILSSASDLPLLPFPTSTLRELIAGLSITERVVCSDGGAMHLAAALGKPIVCFFGNSDAEVWYPWGVPHELLQKQSLNVSDISVEDALAAYRRLLDRTASSQALTS